MITSTPHTHQLGPVCAIMAMAFDADSQSTECDHWSCLSLVHAECLGCMDEDATQAAMEHAAHVARRPWLWRRHELSALPAPEQYVWLVTAMGHLSGSRSYVAARLLDPADPCNAPEGARARDTLTRVVNSYDWAQAALFASTRRLLAGEYAEYDWRALDKAGGVWHSRVRPTLCAHCEALPGETHDEQAHERAMGDPYP